jgi:hypothetical protein
MIYTIWTYRGFQTSYTETRCFVIHVDYVNLSHVGCPHITQQCQVRK